MEENEVKEPSFNFDINECKIELTIPDIDEELDKENNFFSKIHGMITIAITEQYKIEIELKAYIIPYKIDLSIYDYIKKNMFMNLPFIIVMMMLKIKISK